ncbi:hypothetical protein Tco_1001901 [Tanacetum coccineum]
MQGSHTSSHESTSWGCGVEGWLGYGEMVVKEIEDGLVEEMEKLEWWFEQDIDDEREEVKEDEEDEDGGEV